MWQRNAWVANWCPTSCGTGSSRCCPSPWNRPSEAARDARTEHAYGALSSFSEPASPGVISPPKCSAVAASPAGDGCRSGAMPAYFAVSSGICSTNLVSKGRLTGPERQLIPAACEPSAGDQHGSEPDGPRQTGLEAPSCRGQEGPSLDRARHGSEPARQVRGAVPDRRHPSDPWTARSSALPSSQGAWRQGLRLSRYSPRTALPAHHPEDRPKRGRVERKAGAPPLGRRANVRLAPSVQAVADSRGAAWGYSPHAAGARLLPDPLSRYREAFLKPALSASRSGRRVQFRVG